TERWSRFIQAKSPLHMSVASAAFIEFVGFGFFDSHIKKDVLNRSGMHTEMVKLWKWHIAEELEHSFVKLKVINHINNSYWLKFLGMLEALVVANLYVTTLIPAVVRQDAKHCGKKFWPHLWMFLKGLAKTDWGVNRQSVSQYFSKDFDPEIKEPWIADQIAEWIQESDAKPLS
ncbi:MAG: metal-dependent hydrolase, partial [Pseudomonadales bacterium]|nr:metal-dependent hydrolase [Pseudomonadales bacterium]